MSGPLRRGGRLIGESGRTITWSVAEGRAGRRWRWAVGDRRGALIVVHTLETGSDGRFARLESATGAGLLTLHRACDGSVHGPRVTETGIDHLVTPAPAPTLALVGSGTLGVAALVAGLESEEGTARVDVIEILDDLGVRVVECTVRRRDAGIWEVRIGRVSRRARLDEAGLPADGADGNGSWPLEIG